MPNSQYYIMSMTHKTIKCDFQDGCHALHILYYTGLPLTLSVLEVVSPERSDLVLSADVPHCETDVLILHSLNIETYTQKSTEL